MTQEEILYEYYLKSTTKSRNEAIELLKKRKFKLLNRHYMHWFDRKEKFVELKSTLISDVIKELSSIKFQENETEPHLSSYVGNDDIETYIEITSYIYTIVPFEKCESLAKNYTNSSLWKLKHQPKGKDAIACQKIIDRHLAETK